VSSSARSDAHVCGRGSKIVPLSTDDDPDLQDYLQRLHNDPRFDRSRREVVERLTKAGINLK